MSAHDDERRKFEEELLRRMRDKLPKSLPALMEDLPAKISERHGISEEPARDAIVSSLTWFMSMLASSEEDKGAFLDRFAEDLAKEAIGSMMRDLVKNRSGSDAVTEILKKFKKE